MEPRLGHPIVEIESLYLGQEPVFYDKISADSYDQTPLPNMSSPAASPGKSNERQSQSLHVSKKKMFCQ